MLKLFQWFCLIFMESIYFNIYTSSILIKMCFICCWMQTSKIGFETVSWCCWGLHYTMYIIFHMLSIYWEAWGIRQWRPIFLWGSIDFVSHVSKTVNLRLLTVDNGSALLSLWHDLKHHLYFFFLNVFLLWQ